MQFDFYFNTYLFKLDLEGIPYAMLLIIPVKEVNRLQASVNPYYISSLTYGPKQAYLANSCLSSKLQLLPTGHRLISPVLKNRLNVTLKTDAHLNSTKVPLFAGSERPAM